MILKKIAVVSDRIYTDKNLAENTNVKFVCVLSGETTRLDVALDNSKYPDIILKNLGDL